MKTKNLLAAVALTALAVAPSQSYAQDYSGKYPGYKLAYDENFDDPATLDRNFNFETGYCRNKENQYYRRENASVADGNLVIKAESGADEWTDKDGGIHMTFYSSSVKSNARFHYGVWETRAKIPVGPGLWPAIWGTGNTREWPQAGEIDILEYYNFGLHANVAWGDSWQNPVWDAGFFPMSQFAANFDQDYHTWRMEWDHNSIRLYVDDRLLKETKLSRTVNSDGYNPYRDENNGYDIWLNLAIGGMNGGDYSGIKEAFYYVDYTRVYTPEDANAALTLRISRAQALLDAHPDAAENMRNALLGAIAAAESAKGSDDNTMDAALDALQSAIDTFGDGSDHSPAGLNSESLPLNRPFSLMHEYSNSTLRAGWYQAAEDDDKWAKKSLLTIADGTDEGNYPTTFTLVKAPGAVDGYNLRTADGSYVYRDRWYLLVTESEPSADTRCTAEYLFTTEKDANGYVYIRSVSDGKYFATDHDWSWARVYGDKEKNERARFTVKYLADDASGFNAGQLYAFKHKTTGHLLTAGWHRLDGDTEDIRSVMLTETNKPVAADYARRFMFVDAPSGADDDTYFNLRTEHGDYLYCDTWLLKVTDKATPSAADLRSSAYLFRAEKNSDGDVLLRTHRTWNGNNYFGTDDTWPWARVFPDKTPDAANSLFALFFGDTSSVTALPASPDSQARVLLSGDMLSVSGMDVRALILYSMTGVPVLRADAASVDVASLPRGIYILEAASDTGIGLRRTIRL